jgi:hypothetical protein
MAVDNTDSAQDRTVSATAIYRQQFAATVSEPSNPQTYSGAPRFAVRPLSTEFEKTEVDKGLSIRRTAPNVLVKYLFRSDSVRPGLR